MHKNCAVGARIEGKKCDGKRAGGTMQQQVDLEVSHVLCGWVCSTKHGYNVLELAFIELVQGNKML